MFNMYINKYNFYVNLHDLDYEYENENTNIKIHLICIFINTRNPIWFQDSKKINFSETEMESIIIIFFVLGKTEVSVKS